MCDFLSKSENRVIFGKYVLLVAVLLVSTASANQVTIAVASNFSAPAKAIAKAYEGESGYKVQLVIGSSGVLYAQIKSGAPFHVFLSADTIKPATLIEDNLAVSGSLYTYTTGTLVLWSATIGMVDQNGQVLRKGKFNHLALANPKFAPYGVAAAQVLKHLEYDELLQTKLVQGANIAQTFQFVQSGNAELGFISLSQIMAIEPHKRGYFWAVPTDLYDPIHQGAVLLAKGKNNKPAIDFLHFLQGKQAQKIMRNYGYQ